MLYLDPAMPPLVKSCYLGSEEALRAEVEGLGEEAWDTERDLLRRRAKYDRDHGRRTKLNVVIPHVTENPRLTVNGMTWGESL